MEYLLFKLKKDGKTAAYLLIEDGFLMVSENGKNYYSAYEQSPAGGLKICQEGNIFSLIDFDTVHPFVTKDKNGKDVFANDMIKGHYEASPGHYDEIIGEVCFDKKDFLYRVGIVEQKRLYQVCCIELIEDKEDD